MHVLRWLFSQLFWLVPQRALAPSEVIEMRSELQDRLTQAGIRWLSDYGAIDTMQREGGVEVCGIRNEQTAKEVFRVSLLVFPKLPFRRIYYKDVGREVGWKVIIARRVC